MRSKTWGIRLCPCCDLQLVGELEESCCRAHFVRGIGRLTLQCAVCWVIGSPLLHCAVSWEVER